MALTVTNFMLANSFWDLLGDAVDIAPTKQDFLTIDHHDFTFGEQCR
jgi:hypothetical protein